MNVDTFIGRTGLMFRCSEWLLSFTSDLVWLSHIALQRLVREWISDPDPLFISPQKKMTMKCFQNCSR